MPSAYWETGALYRHREDRANDQSIRISLLRLMVSLSESSAGWEYGFKLGRPLRRLIHMQIRLTGVTP